MVVDSEILIRFLLAILWGGMVGAEREYRGKAAGFRTTIMISFGACFFTTMSMAIGNPGNMDRIASNIVTGIGFLGAGVIFRGDNRVNGITTAASIWAVAAVGMGFGGGYYFAAACGSILILFILAVLPYVELYIDRINQSRVFTAKFKWSEESKSRCEKLMTMHNIKFKLVKRVKENGTLSLTWFLQGRAANMDLFIGKVTESEFIEDFEF